jgi:hypothetical protein
MKVKPSKVLMFVCGGGILLAFLLGILGITLNSGALKRAGGICLLIAAIVAFLPLALGCCYVLWEKMQRK